MRVLLTILCAGLLVLPVYAGTITEDVAKMNIPKEDLLKMGETLFNTEGTNTCVYCHGKGGHGGNQAGAADLRHPKTWRSYQALGGDAAFQSNKEKFLKEMDRHRSSFSSVMRQRSGTCNSKRSIRISSMTGPKSLSLIRPTSTIT